MFSTENKTVAKAVETDMENDPTSHGTPQEHLKMLYNTAKEVHLHECYIPVRGTFSDAT